MIATLLQIAAMFSLLSLLAFGGGAAVLPDMQRQAVQLHHWITSREFLDMFALSRAVPPGSMIVVLIGQKAAGLLVPHRCGPVSSAGSGTALVAQPGERRWNRRWPLSPSA
jgi:chromate transport protein ChrA